MVQADRQAYGLLMDLPLPGLLGLVAATVLFIAMVGGILYSSDLGRAYKRARERRMPPTPQPTGAPLAALAADVRRLHVAYHQHSAGQSMTRRRGLEQAYDDALIDACQALGIPDTLSTLRAGTDRDAERMRVEYLLEKQGLPLNQPLP